MVVKEKPIKVIKWIEHNESEGETWVRYFPYNGNEQAYEKLQKVLGDVDEPSYELGTTYANKSSLDDLFVLTGDLSGWTHHISFDDIELSVKKITADNLYKLNWIKEKR